MTRVDEFDSFYRSTVRSTMGVTHALSGDRAATREAVITAYRHAWRDWAKIRSRNPLPFVRQEAYRAVVLEERTHPLRHRQQVTGDPELVAALGRLPSDSRRLIVLMTLGHADLEGASREVGIAIEEGIESATAGLDALESELDQDLTTLEHRISALATVEMPGDLPAAEHIRGAATRAQVINTVAMVIVSLVLVLLGGMAATNGSAFDRAIALPHRERLGAESADTMLASTKIGPADLLQSTQLDALGDPGSWHTIATDDNPRNETPYATCPTHRFATDDPIKVLVRSHESRAAGAARVAQSIEVARSNEGAATAYSTLIRWFADCQHPRVQLINAYRDQAGDIEILRLVSHRKPVRTLTVGFTHAGNITNTLVHEADGTDGPTIQQFEQLLDSSVARLCPDSGGRCQPAAPTSLAIPPHTSRSAGFLAVVDLPPIANIDHVWASVNADAERDKVSRTLCKEPRVGAGATSRAARLFVIPKAGLPPAFGVAQTTASFDSPAAAHDYVASVVKAIDKCPRKNRAASLSPATEIGTPGGYHGYSWKIAFSTGRESAINYRTAILYNGSRVSQVTFTPDGDLDIPGAQFAALATRAAQRLSYLE